MIITDDFSYTTKELVDRGFASIFPGHIRLERYFTEQQLAENIAYSNDVGINSQEWKDRCEKTRLRVAEDNLTAIYELQKKYKLGQFDPDYRGEFQFWFWCNVLENTVRDGRSGRDYSYCTLSLDDHLCTYPGSKEDVFEDCKKILASLPLTSNQAVFQYSTSFDTTAIKDAAFCVYNKIKDSFVEIFHITGKVILRDGEGRKAYCIKRKYSKGDHGCYVLSDVQLLLYGIDHGLL